MKYKISQHLLILYGLTEPSDLIDYSLYCYLLSLRNFSLLFVDGVCIDCGADAGERVDAAVLSNDGPRI